MASKLYEDLFTNFLTFLLLFQSQALVWLSQCYPMMQRRFYSDTSIRHTLLCLISFQLAPKQISPLTVMLSLKRRGRDKGNMLVVRWRMICLTVYCMKWNCKENWVFSWTLARTALHIIHSVMCLLWVVIRPHPSAHPLSDLLTVSVPYWRK